MTIILMCPPGFATGGTELLHQYCREFNNNGVKAYLWFDGFGGSPEDYEEYHCEWWYDDIPEDAVALLPEIYADRADWYERVAICWESVDNYVSRFGTQIPKADVFHIWQSYYSKGFLESQNAQKMVHITDYVADAYTAPYEPVKRENIVLYNPAKGLEYTQRVMQRCRGLQFVPITGMNRAQIVELMHRSKVYIDFGGHPGKDRLPREAVSCGLNIITGRNGGALNPYDICIPEVYKVDRENADETATLVQMSVRNYERYYPDYQKYRDTIAAEKESFKNGIKEFIHEIQHHYPGL